MLQEGEFAPVGSSRTRRIDVRVIAATNRDLSLAVQEGEFRPDLYYRLNVFPITVPPLRERGGDIGLLTAYFVEKNATRMGRQIAPLTPDLIERLKSFDWPGNVRELQNVIERGVITARQGRISLDTALLPVARLEDSVGSPPETIFSGNILTVDQLKQLERDKLIRALQKSRWRVAGKNGAAQTLGMPPSTLQSRMKALGIKKPV
ncbi:MAG: sigma 54-interacting transcriptional regulator [Candidatus Promineifilaceae bacterium]